MMERWGGPSSGSGRMVTFQIKRMPSPTKIAIVAALEREVRPLVKKWQVREREFGGRNFRIYEHGNTTVVCGGIGPEAARRAAEAMVGLCRPSLIVSAGYAGALDRNLRVGAIVRPARIIDASDGSIFDSMNGETMDGQTGDCRKGVLVSAPVVADATRKVQLATQYAAAAVDMEAIAVARVARQHGIDFQAVKAISDERDAELPDMNPFVAKDGSFRAAAFGWHVALRPRLWKSAMELEKSSATASRALGEELERVILRNASLPVTADRREREAPRVSEMAGVKAMEGAPK